MIDEYHANKSRFNANWVWHFLRHGGRATDVGEQHVSYRFAVYSPARGKNVEVEISCELDHDDLRQQASRASALDVGDAVTVTGRLDGRDFHHVVKSRQDIYLIGLSKCRIS